MTHRFLRRAVPLLCATIAAAAVLTGTGVLTTSTATAATAPAWDGTLWATQLDFDNNGTPWSTASFTALKAKGLNSVEIDMPWNGIEPANGSFNFTELDQELANAASAGIRIVPIFWQSGWSGSPASWITGREVTSTGTQGVQPVWWDPTGQPAYFNYVTTTIRHIAANPGYGGSVLDYGFLDAQWDINGGAGGWAQADIDEFHNTYLPQTFGTIAAFNSANATSFTSFSQVPAAVSGQPLAGVYQAFRAWSVQDTYNRLAVAARAITSTPLYIYFGGHIGNGEPYANNPDIFLKVAKANNVTVIDDAAQSPGLTLMFGSLARAYGVKVAQEWTAPNSNADMSAQAAQWVSNYAMTLPQSGGEDFFIHDGTTKDVIGFPIYTGFVGTLQGMSGSYPQQPAAVYIDYSLAFGNPNGGNLLTPEDAISNVWLGNQASFAVVTSQEVANGAVNLSQFKAILPMNGVDATLRSYQSGGGTLLTSGSQLAQFAPAYAHLDNSGSLQTVPAVASNHQSASITLAVINPTASYNGSVTVSPAGLNLNTGAYHLVNAANGAVLPQQARPNGDLCTSVNAAPATLAQWNIVPGAVPAGTPSACSTSTTAAVSLRAHANNDFVTADNAGASPLIANRTAIGVWEQFDLINNPDGSVSFRAHANNNIVTADNAGAAPLIANRTAVGPWEEFTLINNPDGSVSLRAHANNNIVTADNAGASALIANRTAVGAWEEFDLIHD
jgi:hypothetical protein